MGKIIQLNTHLEMTFPHVFGSNSLILTYESDLVYKLYSLKIYQNGLQLKYKEKTNDREYLAKYLTNLKDYVIEYLTYEVADFQLTISFHPVIDFTQTCIDVIIRR